MPTIESDTQQSRDPEIAELTRQISEFTGEINGLVKQIDKAVILLSKRAERERTEGIDGNDRRQ